jgi:hypothetical protein
MEHSGSGGNYIRVVSSGLGSETKRKDRTKNGFQPSPSTPLGLNKSPRGGNDRPKARNGFPLARDEEAVSGEKDRYGDVGER